MTGRDRPETSLDRRAATALLLAGHEDMLVVPGLGSATWDCAALGDNPLHFSLWGAMGNASMIGLGLALAQPARRVLVLTGDGDMLMGLASLATIATQAPANLALVVLDNERHGETGMQPTHTAHRTDLAAAAAACGFAEARQVDGRGGLARRPPPGARDTGAALTIKVKASRPATARTASGRHCWEGTRPSDPPTFAYPPTPYTLTLCPTGSIWRATPPGASTLGRGASSEAPSSI